MSGSGSCFWIFNEKVDACILGDKYIVEQFPYQYLLAFNDLNIGTQELLLHGFSKSNHNDVFIRIYIDALS